MFKTCKVKKPTHLNPHCQLGLSSIDHSVSIHQSCQYRQYSDITKEPKKTDKGNNSVIVKQNCYYLPRNENTLQCICM